MVTTRQRLTKLLIKEVNLLKLKNNNNVNIDETKISQLLLYCTYNN